MYTTEMDPEYFRGRYIKKKKCTFKIHEKLCFTVLTNYCGR